MIEDIDCSLDLSDRAEKAKTKPISNKTKNEIEQENNDGSGLSAGAQSLGSSVSLSGVLNFVDGLWSSCVGERLIIFTTNHPERLDPALLRPGRMDRKIHLSYCNRAAFRLLAKNYLEIEDGHEMMEEAEALLKEVKVTPAVIAEVFMGCDGHGADVAMRRVVEELRDRKKAALSSTTTCEGGAFPIEDEVEYAFEEVNKTE